MPDRYFDFLEGQIASVQDVAVRGVMTRVSKLHRDIGRRGALPGDRSRAAGQIGASPAVGRREGHR